MRFKTFAAVGIAIAIALPVGATADDFKVVSPIALRPVLERAGAHLQQASGVKIVYEWSESGKIKASIEAGESFTVAVLTSTLVDDLVKQGKLDEATKTPVARSGIGVAIRKGAPKPDISTTEAFKQTLLDAKSIGFVDQSASSRYVNELFTRLGIADQVKNKLRPLPGTAAQFVAKGDPELALTQISTIIPFPEVNYAGPLPPDIQRYTVFTLAASPLADRAAVQAFIKTIKSPESAAILRAVGLEPLP